MVNPSANRELDAESLTANYRDLAADEEREEEALQWCEGLIADAAESDELESSR